MILALVVPALVLSTGYVLVRVLRLPPEPLALGLAPSAGWALLAISTTWARALGLPTILQPAVPLTLGLAGVILAVMQRVVKRQDSSTVARDRGALVLLAIAVAVPVVVLETAFAGMSVPISTHDGAHHTEIVDALRQGDRREGWYPPGFHNNIAAIAGLTPSIDSAEAALHASLGLAPLAPLAVFGFGLVAWSSLLRAAACAIVAAVTFHVLYFPQLTDVWPMAGAIILALGVWTVAVAFLATPNLGLVVLGSILVAGLVLTHGTELYTTAVGLGVIVVSQHRKAPWAHVGGGLLVAVPLALLLAAPYLPALFAWALPGGAANIGADFASSFQLRSGVRGEPISLFLAVAGSSGPDIPLRVGLLLAGIWWSIRRRTGLFVVLLFAMFAVLSLAFTYVEVPLIHVLYTATFPWGQGSRLVAVSALLAAMLQGVGLIAIVQAVPRPLERTSPGSADRGARRLRLQRVAVVAAVGLALAEAALLSRVISAVAGESMTYTSDDALVMGWLKQNAGRGDIVANDGAADAGIWAPFKADVAVLTPRTTSGVPQVDRDLIFANIASLNSVPDATAAACSHQVRYVYRGAAGTRYEARTFPPLSVLRQSTGLSEAFSSGEAAVFRIRTPCPNG